VTITEIEAENEFRPAPPPLPSKEKKAKTIKLMNGNAYTFDDSGNQLSVKEIEMPDLSVFIDFYLKNNIPITYFAGVDNNLKSTTDEEVIKGDKETAYVKIYTSADGVSEALIGKKSVVFADNHTGLVSRSAIFNEDHTFNMACRYTYNENPQIPVPVFSKTETYTYNEAGEISVFVTITKNEEINITDNL